MLLDEPPADVSNPRPLYQTRRRGRCAATVDADMFFFPLPGQLIRRAVDDFSIGPDKEAVARINDSLSSLAQLRELRNGEKESELKGKQN